MIDFAEMIRVQNRNNKTIALSRALRGVDLDARQLDYINYMIANAGGHTVKVLCSILEAVRDVKA